MHSTEDAVAFLRELLASPGPEVTELEVRRASLEDTYMAMVRRHEDPAAPRTPEGVPA